MTKTAEPSNQITEGASLLPPRMRRVVQVAAFAMVGFGVYLFAVRGPIMMLDLAEAAYNMFCQ